MKQVDWKRPSPEQSEFGFVAIHISYHSMTSDKGKTLHYQQECPYMLTMIERRARRGDDLPYWVTRIKR